jgi:predicted nicotinamide N-methyase
VTPEQRRDLVRARTRPGRPPVVPELQLHLADDMEGAWSGLQVELDDGDLPPPFWAFAWLGGQAVAGTCSTTPTWCAAGACSTSRPAPACARWPPSSPELRG